MPGISVNKIPIPFKRAGINWSSYWATLISATVENAAPTHVVFTFPVANATVTSDSITISSLTVLSGSWTGAVLTLVVDRPVTKLDINLVATFVLSGGTATITNNVDAAGLLAYYDHVQGAVATTLYDKSGNSKDGTLDAGALPTWTSEGTSYAGAHHITLPALMTDAGDFTIMMAYKHSSLTLQFALDVQTGRFIILNYDAGGSKRYFKSAYVLFQVVPVSIWHFYTFVVSGTDVSVYERGIKIFQGTINAPTALNGIIKIGAAYNNGAPMTGVVAATAFFSGVLSNANIINTYRSVAASLRERGITRFNDTKIGVICDGDSLTAGDTGATYTTNYPSALSTYNPNITGINFGVNGTQISTMLANAGTRIDPLFMASGVDHSVVVCWGGTNDISIFGQNDTDTYADIAAYCSGRQTAGFKVIVLTIIPRVDCVGVEETYRVSINTSIRANWESFADALVDVDADARLQNELDETYFHTDKIHLNSTGYSVVAELVAAAIDALV